MTDYKKTEDIIIGSIIAKQSLLDDVKAEINEEYFFDPQNKTIYKAILELRNKNLEVNSITILNQLKGLMKPIEIATLMNDAIFAESHLDSLILQLKENFIVNKSRDYSYQLATAITEQSFSNIVGVVEELNNFIKGAATFGSGTRTMEQIITDCLSNMMKRKECYDRGTPIGIPSYLKGLDFKIGGFKGNQLIVLAARPGMGKTSFAVHLARKAAQQNYHCLFFSLEMSDTQIGDKIILSQTSVDPDRYKNGSLYDCEILEVNSVSNDLKKLQIEIDDKASSTIQYIESVATVKKKLGLCDAIYVDYIGLIGNESNLKVREQYIADVSRRLKALSKQLDIPVFILAQLNRDVEKRGDKMPQLSDLRESGAIEQDADIVIFIMRPEKYNLTFNDLSDYNLDSYVSDLKGLTIFNIEKNREGGTGIVLARNNEAMNTFTDINY